MTNYYSILEIDDFSSLETIKKAHRKLSLQYHPDLNRGDKWHEEKFKTIQNAYEHLSTAEKKQAYDAALNAYYYRKTSPDNFDAYVNDSNEYQYKKSTPAHEKSNYRFPWAFLIFGIVFIMRIMVNDSTKEYSNVVFLNNNIPAANANSFIDSLAQKNSNLVISTNKTDSIEKEIAALDNHYFTIGSTSSRVIETQGSPVSMQYAGGAKMVWIYGKSSVVFEGDIVSGYTNIDNNLKISLVTGDAASGSGNNTGFKIGSLQDEVLASQGTPVVIAKNNFTNEVTWRYGSSSVIIKNRIVIAYFDAGKNLKIKQ